MFIDLKRLNVGQGFVCYYPYKKGFKSLAVLIQDEKMPENAKSSAIMQLHDHFITINGAHADSEHVMQEAVIHHLDEDTDYEVIAHMLPGTEIPKQLCICKNWDSYVTLCRAINVTRSDHFRLAGDQGVQDRGIQTGIASDRPKSYLRNVLSALGKSHFSVLRPPLLTDQAREQNHQTQSETIRYMQKFASNSYRHIYAEQTDISDEEVTEIYHGWDFYLPQPQCIFEIPLYGSDTKHLFVFAKQCDPDEPEFETLRVVYTPKSKEVLLLPTGSYWMPETTIEDFYTRIWIEPLPFGYLSIDEKDGYESLGHGIQWAIDERKVIFPILAQLNNMQSTIQRYFHASHISSKKQRSPKDFYVFRVKDVKKHRLVEQSEPLKSRLKAFSKSSGTALHPVDEFKRRPAGSPPDAPKTIRVRAHERGDERFGVSDRMLKRTERDHPRLR